MRAVRSLADPQTQIDSELVVAMGPVFLKYWVGERRTEHAVSVVVTGEGESVGRMGQAKDEVKRKSECWWCKRDTECHPKLQEHKIGSARSGEGANILSGNESSTIRDAAA